MNVFLTGCRTEKNKGLTDGSESKIRWVSGSSLPLCPGGLFFLRNGSKGVNPWVGNAGRQAEVAGAEEEGAMHQRGATGELRAARTGEEERRGPGDPSSAPGGPPLLEDIQGEITSLSFTFQVLHS